MTGAGAVCSANPVARQPLPTSPSDCVPVVGSNSEVDFSDSDEDAVQKKDHGRLKTPSNKRSGRRVPTPASVKRSRSMGKILASEMERMNDAAEAETELLKRFLTTTQKASEPDYIKIALEMVQEDSCLQEIGVHNLFSAIKLLKNETEAKVFALIKPDHRVKYLQSLLDE